MGKFSNNWKRRNGNFLGFRSIIDIVGDPWSGPFPGSTAVCDELSDLKPGGYPSRSDLAYCYIFSVSTGHYRF